MTLTIKNQICSISTLFSSKRNHSSALKNSFKDLAKNGLTSEEQKRLKGGDDDILIEDVIGG